jgi:hypothetical protein
MALSGVVLGAGLAGSIGSMLGVFYTPPEKTMQKHLFWLVSIQSICNYDGELILLGLQCLPSGDFKSLVFL